MHRRSERDFQTIVGNGSTTKRITPARHKSAPALTLLSVAALVAMHVQSVVTLSMSPGLGAGFFFAMCRQSLAPTGARLLVTRRAINYPNKPAPPKRVMWYRISV